MRRFFHDSVASRTVLVLLVGITASHILSSAIRYGNRDDALVVLERFRIAERVALITQLLEDTPREERPHVIKTANRPTLRVSWDRESAVSPDTREVSEAELMKGMLRYRLHDLASRRIHVALTDATAKQDAGAAAPLPPGSKNPAQPGELRMAEIIQDLFEGEQFLISVQLTDASWLNFVAPVVEHLEFWSLRSVASLSLMILAVMALSVWAARRLLAPLDALARAAGHLGVDANAPPLSEQGPREVRQAARAFNGMQRRIRRFVEDRTQMVAALSHDLRTPITRLRLRSEFVADPEQQRKMLADLDEMEALVASTVSFAREEASAEPASVFDLTALLQSICDDMADAGHAVEFRSTGRLPYNGRPIALRRCFANMIDNAAKYGKRAEVDLFVEKDRITVRIDDAGPGIPAGERENVFKPFYRVERSRSRNTGGAGLGLTVAQTVVRTHGGEIELSNRAEGGLRALVILPRSAKPAGSPDPGAKTGDARGRSRTPPMECVRGGEFGR